MANTTGQSGWDGPVEMDWDYELNMLRELLATYAPVDTTALRRDLRQPSTTTLNQDKTEITISIEPPSLSWKYARIQDEGGVIRPYKCPKARYQTKYYLRGATSRERVGTGVYSASTGKQKSWVMRAEIGGQTRFFTKPKQGGEVLCLV